MRKYLRNPYFTLSAAALLAASGAMFAAYAAASPVGRDLSRPFAVAVTPFPQRDIIIDGVRLRYIDVGTGTPFLLIPGHASRIEELDVVTAGLVPSFRVVVPDLPGSGYSDKPERDYDLRYYEDELIALLDALGIGRCYVGGGSLGGNLSLRLAYRFPERIIGVIAWAPATAWDARPALARITRAVAGRTLFWPVVRVQSSYWYADDDPDGDRYREEAFAYFSEVMSDGFLMMYWGIAADQVGTSLFDIAPEIAVPTLIIAAERDSTPGMTEGIRRVAAAAGARLVVVKGSGHAISLERPQALIGAILEFADPAGE